MENEYLYERDREIPQAVMMTIDARIESDIHTLR